MINAFIFIMLIVNNNVIIVIAVRIISNFILFSRIMHV